MTDMEMYERVDDVLESQDKPTLSLIGNNETLERKHQKENTKKVSTCVFNTPTCQYCWLLFMVMASTSLSIAALVLTTTEKFDGSWSSWANWEACSTTCDVGMQKRGRSCSNPAPRGTGRQCLGMDMKVRLCQSGPGRMNQTTKVDGSWSSWANWEACSTSCDVGMQKRGRNCSNPSPRGTGRQCYGMDMEVKLCQSEPCRMDQTTTKDPSENVIVDGSWGSWANWEACSTTCDVGMQKRGRNCSNPVPRGTGRQCLGTDMEVKLCQSEPCRIDQTTTKGPSENVVDTYIAFNAFDADFDSDRNNVVFTTVLLNEGGAYNKSDGIFTAPFTGLYLLIGHVCAKVSKDANYALKVEGKSLASGEFRTPSDATDGKCTSFSAVAAVQKEEKVWIECDFLYQNKNDWNSFSGILIHKT